SPRGGPPMDARIVERVAAATHCIAGAVPRGRVWQHPQREGIRLSALDSRISGIPERLSRWFVPHVKGANSVQEGDGSWPGSLPKKDGAGGPSGARWVDTATTLTGRKCHEQTPCASSIPSLCLVRPSPASQLCVRCATQRRCAGHSATMGCSCAWA